ncbi:MAG: transposase [Pseudomonadales bacterium]|jgi:REP element-mobilizing transposase RayT|nr:transposase [Pseudomonadales bacterium]
MTVDPEAPGFYHCVSRCVRRAWLCGDDPATGRNFDHRRGWIEARLLDLAQSFAVSLYAWAVMSNHSHVVLRIDPGAADTWSDEDVARRWARLSRGIEPMSEAEQERRARVLLMQPDRLAALRQRLGSLSWFMRFLNEAVARAANAEDDCTGRFWEGRYKCQALLDESAVLACMTYVDLNPIRAGIADTLKDSDFTSIQRRLRAVDRGAVPRDALLLPLTGPGTGGPELTVRAYVELVARTGRSLSTPKIPAGIRASPDWWTGCVLRIEEVFGAAVGLPVSLQRFAITTGRSRLRGLA